MRLKDIEGLNQADCAEQMEISRQTFQLIIDEARRKVTTALISGMAINIMGGNYTYNICKYKCESCGHEFTSAYEEEINSCPACREEQVVCNETDKFCEKVCRKRYCRNGE
jgi:predicted Zn-ribbon and HTH transcriptional regulator